MLLFEKQEGDLVALRKHEVSLEEVSTSWEGNNKENQRGNIQSLNNCHEQSNMDTGVT